MELTTVYIAGLGAGGKSALPYGTLQLLRSGKTVMLRTERHPVVDELRAEGIVYTSFDSVYEEAEDFTEVYDRIVDSVLQVAQEKGEVVFVVPGHPAVAERSVRLLVERVAALGYKIEWGPGQSFLDDLLLRLGVDPVEGMLMLDAADLRPRDLAPRMHMVIVQMYNRDRAAEVKSALADVYGDEYLVTVARAVGVADQEEFTQLPVFELDRSVSIDHLTTLYVPPLPLREQRLGEWDELVEIVATLRSPVDGCPWDLAQTHESLRPYAIEEAYEVVDAIDQGDSEHLAEELGDLLLQVLLHSQIGADEGYFQVRDVIRLLSEKLLRRHPHVFGTVHVSDVQGVKENWQAIKEKEKEQGRALSSGQSQLSESLLDSVKRALPPFAQSVRLQEKAAEIGFDFPDLGEALDKVREEAKEVEDAVSTSEQEAEIGDLLFSSVNAARLLGVDPEKALQSANDRFRKRFHAMEMQAEAQNIDIKGVSLAILEDFWQNSKETANP